MSSSDAGKTQVDFCTLGGALYPGDRHNGQILPHENICAERVHFDVGAGRVTAPPAAAEAQGHCSPRILRILNEHFKAHYFRDGKNGVSIERLYRRVATAVSEQTDVAADQFLAYELVQWPLYHFLC